MINATFSKASQFDASFGKQLGPMAADFTAAMNGGIVLYRGIERIWLGDGSKTYDGSPDYGVLYADLVDGNVMTIGPVSGYYYAVKSGFTGTYNEWVEIVTNQNDVAQQIAEIRAALNNAITDAEAWAVGQRNGVDVSSDDVTYQNNSKYYASMFDTIFATPATDSEIDSLFSA